MTNNPLLDRDFLYELDQSSQKETYAKIIALDFSENQTEQIEGRVTGGSINIDGTSAVRRTCSLTLVANEININEFYWGLNNKFKLEIGVRNYVNPKYPDIIWFKMGTYVITTFNTSLATNNYTINISGKDKMCLLNGDIGGSLSASVDFGCIESYGTIYTEMVFEDPRAQYQANKYYYATGQLDDLGRDVYKLADDEYSDRIKYYRKENYTNLDKLPIRDIIREAVHTYAKEPYHNIVINDLEDFGLELLEYRGDENHPLYVVRNINNTGDLTAIANDPDILKNIQLKRINNGGGTVAINAMNEEEYDSLVDGFNEKATIVEFVDGVPGIYYTVARLGFGDTTGYRETDLTYPDDLIANVGDSLTSVLDKIKNMLSDFEYFYDVDGRFVFQRKKTYINTSWNTIKESDGDLYAESAVGTSSTVYSFENNRLITAFQNSPVLDNLKNDFSVWGTRQAVNGQEIPIHARFAIDKKPVYYKSLLDNEIYISEKNYLYPEAIVTDWREIIYQMARDNYQLNQDADFKSRLIRANTAIYQNPDTLEIELKQYYPDGFTGYEQYYTDILGFWRQIYNPDATMEYSYTGGKYDTVREIVNDSTGEFKEYETWVPVEYSEEGTCDFYLEEDHPYRFWNKNIVEHPELLNFWFDFLDTGELQQFSVKAVGDRPKSINDKDVTSIYFRETPNIIYYNPDEYNSNNIKSGYNYIALAQGLQSGLFTISAQGKSAKNRIDELLYNHAYCIENITITAIPVYYLEPNTRIYVHDEDSQINGEYLVSKLTIPLTYNGTMSITATKAVERLY